jgi:membrane protein YdbS with pleckstrin-like domain
MNHTYPSKIGIELIIPIVIPLGAVLIFSIMEDPWWVGLSIIAPVIAFIAHMFMTTYYVIEHDNLHIRCGMLYQKTISIHHIKKISETHNPLSSPALSLDRIEIQFGAYDSVMISPKDKTGFIEAITAVNPNITVKYK